MNTFTRSGALALACCAPALAGVLPAPVQNAQEAALAHESLNAVRIGQSVTVQGFQLTQTRSADLNLERFSVVAPDAELIVVDAAGVEHNRRDDLVRDVALFRGTVEGDPTSQVFLSVSPYATHGFVKTRASTYAISTGPDVHDLGADMGLQVSDLADLTFEGGRATVCAVEPGADELNALAIIADVPAGYAAIRPRVATRECEVALDSDWEYRTQFGSANAAAAYMLTLFGAVSEIYERDVDTRLTLVYTRVFDINNDPYPGFDYSARLDHFRDHWVANMSATHRDTAHMFTGGSPSWGGIAYVNALCYSVQNGMTEDYDFGVSAYLNGGFPYPIVSNNSGNWDLVVLAHELGHNFGTGHTHDINWYNPVIDGCGNGDCSAACGGTIMSYCHTCGWSGAAPCFGGGMQNIDVRLHERVIDTITFFIDNFAPPCLSPISSGPCNPADLDSDGDLDLDDISAFVSTFPDMNSDTVFNLDDVSLFTSSFNAGCP